MGALFPVGLDISQREQEAMRLEDFCGHRAAAANGKTFTRVYRKQISCYRTISIHRLSL